MSKKRDVVFEHELASDRKCKNHLFKAKKEDVR